MPRTNDKDLMNSALKNAKGLGSAHHGVDHWVAQKLTALANLPLIFWFIISMASIYGKGASYALFSGWVAEPLNATLLIAMFVSVFYHAKLGSQVVVEDYVHCTYGKKLKIMGMKLFFAFVTIASIVSVLKIAFSAA